MTLALFPMGFGFDPIWFLFMIPAGLLAMWAQLKLKSTYGRYSQVGNARGVTGAQAARVILDRNGLSNVNIHVVPGELTDHYDPAKRAVFLSEENFSSSSLAAVGVAAHEVGHAIQHRTAYPPLHLRMAVVKSTNIASNLGTWLIMIGLFMTAAQESRFGSQMLWLGIVLFSSMALFQAITLPVEYDASRRAKEELSRLGLLTQEENRHVSKVLGAAALTYVAALASALSQLLYYIMIARRRDRD